MRLKDDPNAIGCVAVCCSVLQCVAVCCSVLQCVAVCCSEIEGRSKYNRLSSKEDILFLECLI